MQRCAFGNFEFNQDRRILLRDDKPVPTGVRALALLGALLASRGQPVSKKMLMDAAWPGQAVEESNLSVQIAALRRILGPSPGGTSWIATVPRGGYRFDDKPATAAPTRPIPTKRPSIMVKSFENASGDPRQDYLASGITDDVIIALSRYRWFLISTRQLPENGTDYLIEGSLRKSGEQVRIAVQLIETLTLATVWTDRYHIAYSDIFAIQDEIAERIAGALEPELLKSESVHAVSRHTGNITAWDLVRQGMWHFHHITPDGHARALDLFREAARLDPDLPEAHLWLARVLGGMIFFGWASDVAAAYAEGSQAALHAVLLDERNPYAHYGLAIVSAVSGHLEQAIHAAERAIEINPSFALGHLVHGMGLLYSGHSTDAASAFKHGIELSPHDPHNFIWLNLAGLAKLAGGNAAGGRADAVHALKIRPDYGLTLTVLTCCDIALGYGKSAAASYAKLQALPPEQIDILGMLSRGNPGLSQRITGWLKSAEQTTGGLPD